MTSCFATYCSKYLKTSYHWYVLERSRYALVVLSSILIKRLYIIGVSGRSGLGGTYTTASTSFTSTFYYFFALAFSFFESPFFASFSLPSLAAGVYNCSASFFFFFSSCLSFQASVFFFSSFFFSPSDIVISFILANMNINFDYGIEYHLATIYYSLLHKSMKILLKSPALVRNIPIMVINFKWFL